ncbi:MAG: hypothetical protein M1168_02305 [Candidatus Marsarchaeota archaeon]|nr:hypothetical protein [Candidatus Marsarchaeota archaeon]MCL5094791.1 hypothetical protein [Candidatus Marsarchaeota archaeon]
MKKISKKDLKELEKFKKLNIIENMIKRTDLENTLLSNSSKDSESVSDSFIDSVLNKESNDPNIDKKLKIIEELTKKINENNENSLKSRKTKIKLLKKALLERLAVKSKSKNAAPKKKKSARIKIKLLKKALAKKQK